MSKYARMKSKAGGAPIPSFASAASTVLPDESDLLTLTGTATITSLLGPGYTTVLPGRQVTIIGGSGATVTFTNTNSPTAAGQMYLHGQNRISQEDDLIELIQKNDGSWILKNIVA